MMCSVLTQSQDKVSLLQREQDKTSTIANLDIYSVRPFA